MVQKITLWQPAAMFEIDKQIHVNKQRGTRTVFTGRFHDQPAIIKLFSHPLRRRLHWFICHFQGRAVRFRGIPAPAILYSGYAPSIRCWVIVYEKLENPGDFYWMRTEPDPKRRLEGYMKLIPLFALMHNKGIAQKDTTPGNFLVAGQKVHAIDEDRINLRPWPLGKRASLNNLASLITQFPPENPKDIDTLFYRYMKERGWEAHTRWRKHLDRSIRRFRAWRKDKRGHARRRNLMIAGGIVLAAIVLGLVYTRGIS